MGILEVSVCGATLKFSLLEVEGLSGGGDVKAVADLVLDFGKGVFKKG
jgi:hypothetical protein